MNSTAWLLAELTPAISDLVYTGVTVAFFAVAIAYARFCENVR